MSSFRIEKHSVTGGDVGLVLKDGETVAVIFPKEDGIRIITGNIDKNNLQEILKNNSGVTVDPSGQDILIKYRKPTLIEKIEEANEFLKKLIPDDLITNGC